jgi:hypothetical protein
MPRKNLYPSRSLRVRASLYALIILAAVVSLPPAFTRLTVLAQGDTSADKGGGVRPYGEFVRLLSVPANDIIYNPADQTLYASVPSSGGVAGNSIISINPVTGETGTPVFVGSEPSKLAMSDDGHTLYVALDGASSIRRFDTLARTATQQFFLGQDSFHGTYTANDLAVAPGNPNLVAVARYYPGTSPPEAGVAVFDNGVQRTKTGPSHIEGADFLAFSATESKLYGGGYYAGLRTMTIDASGVTVNGKTSFDVRARIKFANGLVYSSSGQVINPDTSTLLGTFSGVSTNAFVIDTTAGRAYYLTRDNFGSGALILKAFDLNTFVPVGSATLSGISGTVTTMERWGANGLAFRTDSGKVYLLQTSLIPSSEPNPTPTPTPSATPTPTPVYIPTVIKQVNLPANDLVIDAATQTLYASVPSTAGGAVGNTITSVDPRTGVIGASTFIGSEPGKLAISDNGQVLYVNLEGAKAVRRFDTATRTPGLQFTVGADKPADMEVMPGSPQTLAVSRGLANFGTGSVAIFDNGVQRPNVSSGGAYAILPIEFGASPSVLYGYDSYSSGFELVKFEVNASGVTPVSLTRNLISGYNDGFEFAGGRLYSGVGSIVDPETKTLIGKFNGGGVELVVDQALGRAFFLSSNFGGSGSSVVLSAYDINTFLPLGSVTLPNVPGTPVGLVRWGTNGLAFTTLTSNFGSSSVPSQIYLVRSALVSDAEPIESTLQFSAATYSTFEGTNNNTVTITVARTGGIAGTVTVNYATDGGTATPGSDYTATSGTLTFAPGERTKTFTVAVTDDNLYEPGALETIGLTLSAPTGDGTVLGSLSTATLTIQDNEFRPSLYVPNIVSVTEGQSDTTTTQFVVRLSNASTQVISVGYATADGSAKADSDYVATSGTLTFQPGEVEKSISLQIKGDAVAEGEERFAINFSNPVNLHLPSGSIIVIITADDRPLIQFGAAEFTVSEGEVRATITVTRSGPSGEPATVDYQTLDNQADVPCDPTIKRPDGSLYPQGAAFARCDYATTLDTLRFAPGENQKTFTIPLVNDSHVEPQEAVSLRLTTPAGATLGTRSNAVLFITDNDTADQTNPVDAHDFFVRMHYLDFLSREPEADGLAVWMKVLADCPNAFNRDEKNPSAACDRNIVSSSFFRSLEFQLKGYFVYRFYRVALNRRPSYVEFVTDMRRISGQTAEEVYSKRRAFTDAWVLRPDHLTIHGARNGTEFVNALLSPYNLTAINTPDPANPDGDAYVRLTREELIAALDAAPPRLTKAQVLRAVVQSREVDEAEYNGAFVAMQYYGYLRRAPEQSGYDAWLRVITRGDGFRVMVDGFMNSTEYRLRFGK